MMPSATFISRLPTGRIAHSCLSPSLTIQNHLLLSDIPVLPEKIAIGLKSGNYQNSISVNIHFFHFIFA